MRQSGRKRKDPSRYGDYANIEEDDGDSNVDDQSNNADDDDEVDRITFSHDFTMKSFRVGPLRQQTGSLSGSECRDYFSLKLLPWRGRRRS